MNMSALATDSPQLTANDMVMAKQMAEKLHQHYPGHLWAVQVQGVKGIADVRNLMLSGSWGFRLKLPDIYSGSDFDRQIVRAGGELLERYRIRRAGMRHVADEIASAPVDFAGNMIADK